MSMTDTLYQNVTRELKLIAFRMQSITDTNELIKFIMKY